MARTARFSDDDVLDAALSCVAERAHEATVADVATALDGPVGSIYHRFASREVLMGRLWLRSVARFQAGLFVLSRADEDPHASLIAIAVHIPRYCRRHPDEARALTLYRQARLLDSGPAELRDEVRDVNRDVVRLVHDLSRARFGSASAHHVDLVRTATQVCGYGLVRPYLGTRVPRRVENAVAAAADAILRLGD